MTHSSGFVLQGCLPVIAAVIGLSLFTVGCSEEDVQERIVSVRPAKLVEMSLSTDLRRLVLPAVVEAAETTDLTFQVGGLIQELLVVEGQQVVKDEPIARLDQRSFRSELVAAQAQYSSAEAEYKRALELVKQGIATRSGLEQRKTQRDVAWTALDRARKARDDAVLKSPFVGVIGIVQGKAFQNVQPQETIVTLHTTGAAVAVVLVPATLIAAIGRRGLHNPVIVLDAAKDLQISAEFLSISTVANPETQTFKTRFVFTPPTESHILPGMTGTMQASYEISGKDGAEERITIPLDAIMSDGESRYVWVVEMAGMTVSRRQVVLADGVGETLEVLDGLEVGDFVVGAGVSFLHEGMKIRRYEP